MSVEISVQSAKCANFDICERLEAMGFAYNDDEIESGYLAATLHPGEGRGLEVLLEEMDVITLRLSVPCATCDQDDLMDILAMLVRELKVDELICEGEIYSVSKLEEVEKYVRSAARSSLKTIDTLVKNGQYPTIFTSLVPITIDKEELKNFGTSQEKFDKYLREKQSTRGVNELVEPSITVGDYGPEGSFFLKAGRYAIVHNKCLLPGTNIPVKHMKVLGINKTIDFKHVLDEVGWMRFDAERIILNKFSRKQMQEIEKNYPDYNVEIKKCETEESKSRKVYKKLELGKNDVELLDKYFDAMVNLYGVVSLKQVFNIIQAQNPKKYGQEVLLEFAGRKNYEGKKYIISNIYTGDITIDSETVHKKLVRNNMYEYMTLKQGQGDKPYYVPNKGELLKYANEDYVEKTIEMDSLIRYLEKNVSLVGGIEYGQLVTVFALQTKESADVGPDLNFLLNYFGKPKGKRAPEEVLKGLLPLIQNFLNTTRIWWNRGYTPLEIAKLRR